MNSEKVWCPFGTIEIGIHVICRVLNSQTKILRESYEDAEVTELLNRDYASIKVDSTMHGRRLASAIAVILHELCGSALVNAPKLNAL